MAVQKTAVKWIHGEQFHKYSDELFYDKQKALKILPMKLKFIHNDLLMFYKIVNSLVPINLPDYIVVVRPEDTRNTRLNARIHDMSDRSTYHCNVETNTEVFRNAFFCRAVRRWNSLPVTVRQSERISLFKSALNDHMWSSDVDWPD